MNFLHKLVLVWMIAWLPASGTIAAMMPISAMAGGATAMPATSDLPAESSAGMTVVSMPCHDAGTATDSVKTGSCTHCVLCHLATSLMLPSIPDIPDLTPSHDFMATPVWSHTSYFPEPTSPPPRAPAA